jgi:hypothetical protein
MTTEGGINNQNVHSARVKWHSYTNVPACPLIAILVTQFEQEDSIYGMETLDGMSVALPYRSVTRLRGWCVDFPPCIYWKRPWWCRCDDGRLVRIIWSSMTKCQLNWIQWRGWVVVSKLWLASRLFNKMGAY